MKNYKDCNKAHIQNINDYENLYNKSILDNEAFWEEKAKRLTWFKKWNVVSECNYDTADIKWYKDGKLNVSYNCIDRHIKSGYGDKTL